VYVDDVVNAMAATATAPGVNQKIINIGSGKETSIRELVNLVLDVTHGKPEVVYNPRNEGGVRRMQASLTLASQLLNYRPQVDLRSGLQMTFEKDARLRLKS
jgi:UDP-glucose 4-epimerase